MDFSFLPESILHETFKYLDSESILNCFLVCKCWKNVIDSSTFLMRHFRLNIKAEYFLAQDDCLMNTEELLGMERKFQEVEMEISEENREIMKAIAVHHGPSVTKLILHANQFDATDFVESFFENFSLLEELQVFNFRLYGDFSEKVSLPFLKVFKASKRSYFYFLEAIDAPNIKILEITHSAGQFGLNQHLRSFLERSSQLESLVFRNDVSYRFLIKEPSNFQFNLKVFEIMNGNTVTVDGLGDFLTKFSNLQDLTLVFGFVDNFKFPLPQNCPFRLKKLRFDHLFPYDSLRDNNFCEFLEAQKDTLQEISLVSIYLPTIEADLEYLTLFTAMKKLESLTFDMKNSFPTSDEFYQVLQPIPTVKELYFVESFPNRYEDKLTKFLRMILPMFPNLEIFECPEKSAENFTDLVEFLNENNPKLRIISLFQETKYLELE